MAEWYNRLQDAGRGDAPGHPGDASRPTRATPSATTRRPASWPARSRSGPSRSAWPPTGDAALVEQFGDIARQEYLAVGIRVALHPMADLATEPRWARINGTFGEDAALSARMTAAYIRGFQGATLGPHSVACMTKHFPGGGPQKDGEDPHFPYGREQVYPGDNFDYHLIPFEAAFAAGTAQIMPYYGMPVGTPLEEVGFGFNKDVITGLLREKYGFDGVVCTDWGLLTDSEIGGQPVPGARLGRRTPEPRRARPRRRSTPACDQFGGEACPEVIVELVRSGQIAESRHRRVGAPAAARQVPARAVRQSLRGPRRGGAASSAAPPSARRASRPSAGRIVLLKNGEPPRARPCPCAGARASMSKTSRRRSPRATARWSQRRTKPTWRSCGSRRPTSSATGNFLERLFHAGDLDFKEPEKSRILGILATVPTIVDIYLDRPAVIPEIAAGAAALLADFGANDAAVLDVIFGRFAPSGKLPFELPSSMEAVRRQQAGCAVRLREPAVPVRAWPDLLGRGPFRISTGGVSWQTK